MTRKDYELIAKVLNRNLVRFGGDDNEQHTPQEREIIKATLEVLADDLADELQTDNERFDHLRFMSACGFNL